MVTKHFIITGVLLGIAVSHTHALTQAELLDITLKERKEECDKNGTPEIFNEVERISTELWNCVHNNSNLGVWEDLGRQLMQIKPDGKIKESCRTICDAYYRIKGCLNNDSMKALNCYDASKKNALKTIEMTLYRVADFFCEKDAEQLVSFLSGNGHNCFKQNKNQLSKCFDTVNFRFQDLLTGYNREQQAYMKFDDKELSDFNKIQKCAVDSYKKLCESPTTASIVSSAADIFKQAAYTK